MTTVYTGIDELVTNDPALGDGSPLGIVADAAFVVDSGRIAWVGRRARRRMPTTGSTWAAAA